MKRTDDSAGEADDGVREIPTWARRYAQNLTLPVVVSLVIFAVASCMFGGLSYLTAWAYVNDKRVLAGASMLVLCAFAVSWVWFSFVGGTRIMRQITKQLYRGEGSASVGPPLGPGAMSHPPTLIGFVFMFCVLASVGLGLLGFLPTRYMQPISAVYVVPFLCYIGLKVCRGGSPFMFLWPALYAIHAVLLVTGVPIGMGPMLDMFVPTVGYGLIAALAGHIYSRVALRRLRRLAASPEVPQETAE
ncbi:MAG: hypothetical protein JSV79_03655 [Armatimonadota bacterium]|nr:MAG: hypothetical protein JSV79_03655 [Armatimonadota bacterium]